MWARWSDGPERTHSPAFQPSLHLLLGVVSEHPPSSLEQDSSSCRKWELCRVSCICRRRRNLVYTFLRNRPKQRSAPFGCFVSTWNIFHRERCDVFLSEVVHVAHQTGESFQAKVSGLNLSNPALVKVGTSSRFFVSRCFSYWLVGWFLCSEKDKKNLIIFIKVVIFFHLNCFRKYLCNISCGRLGRKIIIKYFM